MYQLIPAHTTRAIAHHADKYIARVSVTSIAKIVLQTAKNTSYHSQNLFQFTARPRFP